MELGREVCRPRSPDCGACPLALLCPTRAHGWQQQIPAAGQRLNYEERNELAVVVRRRQQVLLRRCGPEERWAGLWDFPRFAASGAAANDRWITQQVQRQTGVAIRPGPVLTVLRHGVTRFRITLTCREAQYRSGRLRTGAGCAWVDTARLPDYPLSVSGRKISRLLESR